MNEHSQAMNLAQRHREDDRNIRAVDWNYAKTSNFFISESYVTLSVTMQESTAQLPG